MRRECILVVDNDQAVHEMVALTLRDACEVRHARTGAQAIGIVRRDPVAVVVLDYRLSDCTGLHILSEMRAARPDLPVIMVTGYGSEALRASAFKLGIRDYLAKPLNAFRLRRSVYGLLSTARDGARRTSADRAHEPWEGPSAEDRRETAIEKVAVLIQRRYWEHLTLPGLAREVGVSKYRLSRRFHEVMGVTLRGYLLWARLEKAKDLLATTREQITEVALAVGYGDLPRFDKLFKRYTGVTPSAYRDRTGRDRTGPAGDAAHPAAAPTARESATGT
jgi:two-component system response regulator YesN